MSLGTDIAHNFCAGISPLQLCVVVVKYEIETDCDKHVELYCLIFSIFFKNNIPAES